MGRFTRRRRDHPAPSPWVRVAFALHQPEAEMMAGILGDLDIPVLIRRTTMDVPDMLAGGPRELLVPEEHAADASAALAPLEPADES